MLSAKEIINSRENPLPELPTIGVKDFEPNGSLEQSSQIQSSISAIKSIISHERVKLVNTLSQAVWRPELCLAEVTHQTGSYWEYMGHKLDKKLYIYPEEALYLLETGVIQIVFNEVPLSIQRAYFLLLNTDSKTTLEKYRVYSTLSSYGYKVLRHSPLNSVTNYEKKLEVHKLGIKLKHNKQTQTPAKRQEDSIDCDLKSCKKLKTETNESLFSSTKDFITDNMETKVDIQCSFENDEKLDFDYDLYSGSNDKLHFKKSCLQLPNFRVVIHRCEDPPPDFQEVSRISNKYKDEIPVIHAIVFFDNIAFYSIHPMILPDVHH